MKTSYSFYCLFFGIVVLLSGCSAVKKVNKVNLRDLITKPADQWTSEECDAVIKGNTLLNKSGLAEKNRSERSFSYENVYISAIPLNFPVIHAIVRKEAIQRRFSASRYRERLKEYFEKYTNLTVDSLTGLIMPADPSKGIFKDEISFIITFENISVPFRIIEVNRAEEGFFLENAAGEFTRVTSTYGYYAGEDFLLNGELKLTITFSLIKDDGTKLFQEIAEFNNCRLVFNGLQEEPVIVMAE